MSFLEFVRSRRITRNPRGDFITDAKTDENLPDAKAWGELEAYLRRVNACSEAMVVAKGIWREYIRETK